MRASVPKTSKNFSNYRTGRLRVFPMVTFPPHLRYNSPRLNDLAIRSNEYLTSKTFLLTIFLFRAIISYEIGAPAPSARRSRTPLYANPFRFPISRQYFNYL